MAIPRVYLDACCLIEALKGRAGAGVQHPKEAIATEQILRAARDEEIEAFTSALTVAEVIYVNEDPPGDDERAMIERFMLSGRDGLMIVEPSPFIAIKARDLAWKDGFKHRAMDRLHVASALQIGAAELLTLDGRLAKRFNASSIEGCRLIPAHECSVLPSDYKTDDLFKDA